MNQLQEIKGLKKKNFEIIIVQLIINFEVGKNIMNLLIFVFNFIVKKYYFSPLLNK